MKWNKDRNSEVTLTSSLVPYEVYPDVKAD
jgi:hypothetical protein